jgi:hypothetical protein
MRQMTKHLAVLFVLIGSLSLSGSAQNVCPGACSIWPASSAPGTVDSGDPTPSELGVKFRSDVNGYVTGVRFYKSSANTGVHIGNLWSDSGALLASATFVGETASGWQQVNFGAAIPITQGTTYIVSYHTSTGHYSFDANYFATSGVDNAPLHALVEGVDGSNGVTAYNVPTSSFPTQTYQSSNYWVDVVFSTVNAPNVSTFAPVGTGASVSTAVTATFTTQLDASTVTATTFQLLDGTGTAVPGSVSYNSSTQSATLQPLGSLSSSTAYTAVVAGGPGGVKGLDETPMASNFSWQFTTATPPPPPPVCPCSIWNLSTSPGSIDGGDSTPGEYGVKFRSDVAGSILGIRFFKAPANTGTHIGNLWTSSGQLLGTATSSSESSSGWQTISFNSPVFIAAGTVYVASYYAPQGHYSFDAGYLQNGVDHTPLHAIANTVSPNAVFSYSASSTFPVSSYNGSNYWVDVMFVAANSSAQPVVSTTLPSSEATGWSIGGAISATFNEPMDGSTFNSSTVLLTDSSNNAVPGTVAFAPATATVTFTPSVELSVNTTYTATIKGSVKDTLGNSLGSDYLWSFTTGGPPSGSGPGGPILVISSATNPFTKYYDELLRTEGLNEFSVQDISAVNASILSFYRVAILGDMKLTSAQVSMLSTWVMGGGNLIAMHPDKQLATLLGLGSTAGTLSDAYLLVNTKSGAGVGIVPQTIQFHGTADLYTLSSASSLATLYSSASTASTFPAVTLNSSGAGQAAAFTYDLARSVVYTRQGNPAWAGQNRSGAPPIRTDDLFYGNAPGDPEPNWVDLNKVQIPQADEQQRLLANIIQQMTLSSGPLPRFWYFPNDFKAVVIMTGDDHNQGGTVGRFDEQIAESTPGCSVADWQCIRSTSYMWTGTPITDAQAAAYVSQGFELSAHIDSGPTCSNWTTSQLNDDYSVELATFAATWPSISAPTTHRMHCVTWSDYDSQPIVELAHGIRLDTTYYWYPDSLVQGHTGLFTGSGMPMRFTDRNGNTLNIYQAATQLPDEDTWVWPDAINTLLDNATGPLGYYGVITNNMHTDYAASEGADAIVASAQAHGVPLVSSQQMLTWLDGRNSSYFGDYSWNNGTLAFSITVASGANNLDAMVSATSAAGGLSGITVNGAPISYWLETIKGIQYAFFNAQNGSYQVFYGGSGPTVLSSITLNQASVVGGQSVSGTVTLSGAAPASGALVKLSSTNTAAAQVLSSVLISGGTSTANFTVTTLGVATATTVTVTGTYGTQQTAQLTVLPTPPVPSSLVVSPTSVVGGNSAQATVTLNRAAPAGGTVVTLSSDKGNAQVPASVTVPPGATSARFTVTTTSTAGAVTATLSASANGVTKTTSLSINPPGLSTLGLNPTSVVGGTSSTGTVTLTGPAPSGGLVVSLSDNNAAAQTPATVTVPASASSASFTITTTSVTTTTSATINATYNGITRSATLTINPWLASVSMSPTSVVGGASSTGTVTLNAPAPTGGILVTLSDNNAAATAPASVTVAANARTASFAVTTVPVSTSTTVTVSASYNGTTRTASLTITPPGLSTLSLNPTSVVGGTSSSGTVTLSGPAPSGGLVVSLSDNNVAAQTPATVTVPGNASSASFAVTTSSVTTTTSATVSATYNGTTRTATLTINPWLASVSMSPTSVVGGTSSTGTVTLNAPAPSGGILVTLSDNNAAATAPASVTVAANARTATFTVTTTPVSSSTTVTVSASYNGVTRTASFTITPPAAASLTLNPASLRGGGTSTGTVTLTGPAPAAGTVVTLSSSSSGVASVPASITVASGSTAGSFTISTRSVNRNTGVTISATAINRVTALLTVTP